LRTLVRNDRCSLLPKIRKDVRFTVSSDSDEVFCLFGHFSSLLLWTGNWSQRYAEDEFCYTYYTLSSMLMVILTSLCERRSAISASFLSDI